MPISTKVDIVQYVAALNETIVGIRNSSDHRERTTGFKWENKNIE